MDRTFELCVGLMLFLVIGSGILGNVLSFLVWTKGRRCKKLPGGIYLRALAVSDTIALFTPALNEAIRLVSQFSPAQNDNFLCKLDLVGRHYGLIASSWIVVCFTLDRTQAIFRSTTSNHLFNRKGTIAIMLTVFFASFVLNLPYGIVYGLKEEPVTQPSGPTVEIQPDLDVLTTSETFLIIQPPSHWKPDQSLSVIRDFAGLTVLQSFICLDGTIGPWTCS